MTSMIGILLLPVLLGGLGEWWPSAAVMATTTTTTNGRGRLRTLNELLIESQSVDEDDLPAFISQQLPGRGRPAHHQHNKARVQEQLPKQLAPKKKQIRVKRLRRTLGRDFDEQWMSVSEPKVKVSEQKSKAADLELLGELTSLNASLLLDDQSNSQKPGVATLTPQVAKVVEKWLLQRASCPVTFVWDDFGDLFWPRWVKRGVCGTGRRDLDRKYGPGFIPRRATAKEQRPEAETQVEKEKSCSWPAGMHCVPFDSHTIRVLRWHCYPRAHHDHVNDRRRAAGGGGGRRKSERKSMQQRKTRIKCTWIKVPYPVTSECFCSC